MSCQLQPVIKQQFPDAIWMRTGRSFVNRVFVNAAQKWMYAASR
jgi:hypothetical protein